MTGRVVNPDGYRRMPWKNGGGETIEIAIFPPGAGLDDFGWRISTATVASDGPFSIFESIDRTLCVLSGAGISLAVRDDEARLLDQESPPFSFPADAPAAARLIDGPIVDLNVMARRGAWRHEVRRHRMQAGDLITVDAAAVHTIVFCRSGSIDVDDGSGPMPLGSNATLFIEKDAGTWMLRAIEPAIAFIILIEQANS
jgi:environmental stress-induced protein Ves